MNTDITNVHAATPRIAVIGGGISGLAAAHRIVELLPNAELSLFEASSRLGGVLDTAQIGGFLVERSADNFLTKLPAAVDLCRRLGIADQLEPTNESRRRALVVRDGRLLPIPVGFYLMSARKLKPLLASPILSIPGKLRLLAEPLIPRGPAANSDPTSDLPLLTSPRDESVASFVRRRLGNEVFERLVQPLVAGIYAADPEKLSMSATMPEFLAQERAGGSLLSFYPQRTGHLSDQSESSGARYSLFTAPRAGMTSLVTALAARLPPNAIHLNTPVTSVRRSDDRWHIDFEFRISDHGLQSKKPQAAIHNPQSFDALILALPAHAAAKLLHSPDASLSDELAAIEHAGCAVVSLGFARSHIAHPLDAFGFVVPQVENRRIIAASFASLKFAGRAPGDHVLIRVFIGGALQPELAELPNNDLHKLAREELAPLLGITGEPMMTDIARWPASMPQYHVGHLDRVARIEQLAAAHPNLALAGNAYHGVGIPQCIASGESAAERIATHLA